MNIKNFIIGTCALALIASCKKEDLKVTFGMNAKEVTFIVKANPNAGEMKIDMQNLTYNLDSVCKANSMTKDQIKSVKINEVYLDIVDDKVTFDLVDWAEAYVGASGKADILLASKNPVEKNSVKTISLDLKDVELVEYIKANQMSFFAKGKSNAPLDHDITMRARIKFNITGQLVR